MKWLLQVFYKPDIMSPNQTNSAEANIVHQLDRVQPLLSHLHWTDVIVRLHATNFLYNLPVYWHKQQ